MERRRSSSPRERADTSIGEIGRRWLKAPPEEHEHWRAERRSRLESSPAWHEILAERGLDDWVSTDFIRDVFLASVEFVGGGPATMFLADPPPGWSTRQLDAFARRAERIAEEARSELGLGCPDVIRAAELARELARRKRERPQRAAGAKLRPETDLLAKLDRLLQPIPGRRRRELMAQLLREVADVDVGSAEQVRLRLKDYRRRGPHPPLFETLLQGPRRHASREPSGRNREPGLASKLAFLPQSG